MGMTPPRKSSMDYQCTATMQRAHLCNRPDGFPVLVNFGDTNAHTEPDWADDAAGGRHDGEERLM
eukprot:scaffold176804_cov35-Tisochrysis_lutea.AAC.2